MSKWLLLFALSISASASVTINATFVGPNQAPAPFAYLTLDLMDCGYNVPSVPGAPASMVLKHMQFTPAQLPATIYGNNEISCGNSYSTLWHVTAWADSTKKLAGDYNYDLCSSTSNCLSVVTATWDLSSAQPFVGSPPPPGFRAIFGNPVQSQTLKQPANTSFSIYGVLDLTNATVLGLGNVGINAQTLQGNAICTTAPADTFVLAWSAASNWWCPAAGGGASSNATQIQGRNVLSTLPTSSQFLGFDGTNWLPKSISGFLSLGGGTLTGALTLPGNAASALQATPLQQIQSLLTAKADIVSGFVPTSELGSGGGGLGNKCLVDNNTWSSACGSGGGGGASFPLFSTTPGSLTTPAYSFTATTDLGLAATVSTSAKYTILSSTRAGGTVTSTLLAAVTFSAGQSIQVTAQVDPSYNCTSCQLTSVSNGGLTIQYPAAGNDGSSTGGSVSPWENVLTGYMQRFNRLESSSANAAKIGSIRGGPTDPWNSGCPSCSTSAITGTTDQNVIRPQAANGPVLVGDYQGVQASGPIFGQGPLYVSSSIPGVAPTVGAVGTSGLAANTTGSVCMWVNGGVCHDLANVDSIFGLKSVGGIYPTLHDAIASCPSVGCIVFDTITENLTNNTAGNPSQPFCSGTWVATNPYVCTGGTWKQATVYFGAGKWTSDYEIIYGTSYLHFLGTGDSVGGAGATTGTLISATAVWDQTGPDPGHPLVRLSPLFTGSNYQFNNTIKDLTLDCTTASAAGKVCGGIVNDGADENSIADNIKIYAVKPPTATSATLSLQRAGCPSACVVTVTTAAITGCTTGCVLQNGKQAIIAGTTSVGDSFNGTFTVKSHTEVGGITTSFTYDQPVVTTNESATGQGTIRVAGEWMAWLGNGAQNSEIRNPYFLSGSVGYQDADTNGILMSSYSNRGIYGGTFVIGNGTAPNVAVLVTGSGVQPRVQAPHCEGWSVGCVRFTDKAGGTVDGVYVGNTNSGAAVSWDSSATFVNATNVNLSAASGTLVLLKDETFTSPFSPSTATTHMGYYYLGLTGSGLHTYKTDLKSFADIDYAQSYIEQTAPTVQAITGVAQIPIYASSVDHRMHSQDNSDSLDRPLTKTVGTGTSTSNGTIINAGTSQAQPAITITGATTSDVATCSLNAAPVATWQTGIQLLPAVVTANTVTPWLSNPTAGNITPAATAIRCTVIR